MRTHFTFILCALLIAAPIVESLAADAPATAPAKNATGLARCRFELREERLAEDVTDLIASAIEPVAEILGTTPDQAERFINVNSPDNKRFNVAVILPPADIANAFGDEGLPPDKMLAEKALRKVMLIVEDGLVERQLEIEGMSRTKDAAQQIKIRREEAAANAAKTEAAILEKIGPDLPVDVVRGGTPNVYNERESLKLQQLGKQARQQALAQAIERLSKAAEKQATEDPVAKELLKVIEARMKALQRQAELFKNGAASEGDITNAESALAEARAKMLERQEAVKQSAGGDLLSNLNRELAALSIDAAETEARLAYIETALKKQAEIRPLQKELDQHRIDEAKARADLEALEPRLKRVQTILEGPPIRLMRFETMKPGDPRIQAAWQEAQNNRSGAAGGLFGGSPEGH